MDEHLLARDAAEQALRLADTVLRAGLTRLAAAAGTGDLPACVEAAHDVLVFGERVGHAHPAGRIDAEQVQVGLADEAVDDRLVETGPGGEGLDLGQEAEFGQLVGFGQGFRHLGQFGRDAVQTVDPADFFNEVGLALQIQAVGGRNDGDDAM